MVKNIYKALGIDNIILDVASGVKSFLRLVSASRRCVNMARSRLGSNITDTNASRSQYVFANMPYAYLREVGMLGVRRRCSARQDSVGPVIENARRRWRTLYPLVPSTHRGSDRYSESLVKDQIGQSRNIF